MTGFKSKKTAALDEDGMYLVHQTNHSEDNLHMVAQPVRKKRPWVGLTDEEIGARTILAGFNPEWKIEIGMVFSIVRNLEAKLKEKNNG